MFLLFILSAMEIRAKVEKLYPIESKTGKDGSTYETQNIVIVFNETEQYPSKMVLNQFGEKQMTQAKQLKEGDVADFSLNFKVNEYNGKAYGSISAWKIDVLETESTGLPL